MAGRLASKVVIVTGGATGIGRAVAGRAVSDGRALFVATDVTVEREVERLAAAAVTGSAGWTARSTTRAA